MGFAHTIKNQSAIHFVTFTVHQWVDVFTRQLYIDILYRNLKYCQAKKGLEIFGYVIMSNHCHFILRAKNENLSDIIRDFKKHTAKVIYKAIQDNIQESRKNWMTLALKNKNQIWFWEEGYHGEEIFSQEFFDSKLNYIHQNPIKRSIVEKAEDYINSSAGDLFGIRKGELELVKYYMSEL